MKKILSLVLSVLLIISCMGIASAREEAGEKKSYIVVLEAPAVYSPDRVTFYGADDDMYREALLELQAEIKVQITGGVSAYSLRNTERTYTYTDVLNGFTVNVDAQTAKEIEKIDGVKAVYENKTVEMIKPAEVTEGETVQASEEVTTSAETVSAANSGNMMNTSVAYERVTQARAVRLL